MASWSWFSTAICAKPSGVSAGSYRSERLVIVRTSRSISNSSRPTRVSAGPMFACTNALGFSRSTSSQNERSTALAVSGETVSKYGSSSSSNRPMNTGSPPLGT